MAHRYRLQSLEVVSVTAGEVNVYEYSDSGAGYSNEWRLRTERWEGSLQLNLRDREGIEIVVPSEAAYSADDVEVVEERSSDDPNVIGDGPTWLLLLPTILGLVALGVDWANPFSPASSIGSVLNVVLYWPYTLFSIVGTLYLYEQASALSGRGWQANPWLYVLAGGLGFTVVQALLGALPSTWELIGASLAGAFIFGCAVASSITGPIFLLVRRRLSEPPRDDAGPILSQEQEDQHNSAENRQKGVQ